MDEFDRSLQRDQVHRWADQYIAYRDLQDKIDAAAEKRQDKHAYEQRKQDVECEIRFHLSRQLAVCNSP